jgi:hypothetical protein
MDAIEAILTERVCSLAVVVMVGAMMWLDAVFSIVADLSCSSAWAFCLVVRTRMRG